MYICKMHKSHHKGLIKKKKRKNRKKKKKRKERKKRKKKEEIIFLLKKNSIFLEAFVTRKLEGPDTQKNISYTTRTPWKKTIHT